VPDFTDDDDALLAELGVEVEAQPQGGRSAREERVVAGFEDIQRFYEQHGRAPLHGEERDIFERLYAVRLDRLRGLSEYRDLLEPLDHQGLLGAGASSAAQPADGLDDDELLAQLGVEANGSSDITSLRHVRSTEERRAAEDIANRERCEDFDRFKPLFDQVQAELKDGTRQSRPFELKAEIKPGAWFIVAGQMAYVAEAEASFTNAQGRTDARLRIIFDNGTQSNMLMRSLQRSLNKDEAGRRITDPVAGPLFSDSQEDSDEVSGTIYVLRSKSNHPVVSANRELVHKIGVTGSNVAQRLAGARLQTTFLMADVEVVTTYRLFNINRSKFESLIHKIFDPARLDIEVRDRFDRPIVAREWFLVPLFVIDEAVKRIQDGTIIGLVYDPSLAKLVDMSGSHV
jgi:hypothetical protein